MAADPRDAFPEVPWPGFGYEYDVEMSLTRTFGSIFSSIVNPRSGQQPP